MEVVTFTVMAADGKCFLLGVERIRRIQNIFGYIRSLSLFFGYYSVAENWIHETSIALYSRHNVES